MSVVSHIAKKLVYSCPPPQKKKKKLLNKKPPERTSENVESQTFSGDMPPGTPSHNLYNRPYF